MRLAVTAQSVLLGGLVLLASSPALAFETGPKVPARPLEIQGASGFCSDGSCDAGEDAFNCPEDCPPVCGNGVVEPTEECDDGGTTPGDGCSATCTVEVYCTNGTCDAGETVFDCPEDCLPVCGNGVIEPTEECDDGGTIPGDGCSATCTVEVYCTNGTCDAGESVFDCPEDCPPVCGNGVIEPTEECDDGGTTPGDGCSATCTVEIYCTNGTCDSGETVFDCPEDCTPVCGNGVIEPTEECDDGGTAPGDGCTPACRVDVDLDEIPDAIDNCPLTHNPDQSDDDVDTIGNVCDNCPSDFNPWQIDADGDTFGEECDCAPADPLNWQTPGEVTALLLAHASGTTTLAWTAPAPPGAAAVVYDTIRSADAADFSVGAGTVCVETDDGADTESEDVSTPSVGTVSFFLIRAENDCPAGDGPLGNGKDNLPRTGRSCP